LPLDVDFALELPLDVDFALKAATIH
jgi:hypothetical protein